MSRARDEFEAVFARDLAKQTPPIKRWQFIHRYQYPILAWQRNLRKIEALERYAAKSFVLSFRLAIMRALLRSKAIRLGFTIPTHTFGSGLSIAHWGTIAVGKGVKVGKNCRIHQGVTIGRSNGASPVLGNDCFIGANASIVGAVVLGDRVKIGAGAVVVHSFPSDSVLVGNPAVNKRARQILAIDAANRETAPGDLELRDQSR
jgi:serine O-acetyltransferase